MKWMASSINAHPKTGESLNRISIVIVPDPFFPSPTQKKKAVWLHETKVIQGWILSLPLNIMNSWYRFEVRVEQVCKDVVKAFPKGLYGCKTAENNDQVK